MNTKLPCNNTQTRYQPPFFKKAIEQKKYLSNHQPGPAHRNRIHMIEKDEKYFEKRKKNNLAAKKSRDAKKQRDDQVRTFLVQEF